jgi:hypothetical protein
MNREQRWNTIINTLQHAQEVGLEWMHIDEITEEVMRQDTTHLRRYRIGRCLGKLIGKDMPAQPSLELYKHKMYGQMIWMEGEEIVRRKVDEDGSATRLYQLVEQEEA